MGEFTTAMPISTYEQAIWRLVQFEVSERHTPEQIALAVTLVADIFWFSEAKVRHDLKKGVRKIDPPAPRRRLGWAERQAVV